MARVEQINYETASKEIKKAHDYHIENVGRMTNMKRTLLQNVPTFEVLMEWYKMRDEAAKFLDDLEINFFCHAISSENECVICSLFFVKIMKDNGIDHRNYEFTARQQALIDFGQAIVRNPRTINEEVFAAIKTHFTDKQIVVLTGFAGMMIATNLINNVLEVEVDDYLETYK